jgi:hypothetical protein
MALFVAVSLGRAAAQMNEVPGKGRGTGRDSTTSPPTRSAGTAAESAGLAAHDLPFSPRRGLMGAPGAAPDEAGPARLGGHGERSWRPSFGESAQPGPGGGEAYEPWKSGDRIRSWTSADVRAARVQQAPDLEWAPSGGKPSGTRGEPQEPYGVRFSLEQQAPLR